MLDFVRLSVGDKIFLSNFEDVLYLALLKMFKAPSVVHYFPQCIARSTA